MPRLFPRDTGPAIALAALLALGGCKGTPTGFEPDELGLLFVDGPADHVAGAPIPPFRVWVTDLFGRRFTGLDGGTLTLDLLDPGGAVQSAGFATVPLSFGEGTVTPSISLQPGVGYSVRGRFERTTEDSPPFAVVSSADAVQMTNFPAGEAGLLVDGANNIGQLPDLQVLTTTPTAEVGVLNSSGSVQALAVFPPDRRPELVPVTWTPGVDMIAIDLVDPVAIPVTVWIVTGNFATEKARVEAALSDLTTAWRAERFGVAVGDVVFMDATHLAADFEIFAVGMGAPFGPIGMGVGRTPGRFNIYVVSEVRNNAMDVPGFAEQPGMAIAVRSSAVMADGARPLGHELGHNFGLFDSDNVLGFEIEQNMMGTGQSSTVLTEGQTFRAHFNGSSPLRQFRSGDDFQTLFCPAFEASTHCPEVSLRIWTESDPAPTTSSR